MKAPAELWKVPVGGPVAGSPTIGPDGTIYVASHDGNLYAIDPAGKVKWTFKTADRSWSTPAVAQDGTIYVGSDDDHLYAVKADGSLKWKLHLGACDPKGAWSQIPEGFAHSDGETLYVYVSGQLTRRQIAAADSVPLVKLTNTG